MIIKNTETKQINDVLEASFHDNNFIMKPHLYKNASVVPITLNGTIYDINCFWNEEARIREGFETDYSKKIVFLPSFFVKIDGVYENKKEYDTLIMNLKKDSLFFNSLNFIKYTKKLTSLPLNRIMYLLEQEEFNSKTFKECINFNSRNLENSIFSNLNIYLLDNIINKLSDFCNLYKNTEKFNSGIFELFILNVVYMEKELIKLLMNWDYPYKVPKIVFLDDTNETIKTELNYLFIHFLSFLGMDIAILCPSGRSTIESFDISFKTNLTSITLDKFIEPKNKEDIINIEKELPDDYDNSIKNYSFLKFIPIVLIIIAIIMSVPKIITFLSNIGNEISPDFLSFTINTNIKQVLLPIVSGILLILGIFFAIVGSAYMIFTKSDFFRHKGKIMICCGIFVVIITAAIQSLFVII